MAYPSKTFHRGDRSSIHTDGAPRCNKNTSLPPLQPTQNGQLQHSPVLEANTSSFKSPLRAHSPSHVLPAGTSSSSVPIPGMTQLARAQVESAPLTLLSPSSTPTQAVSSSGKGKGGSRRDGVSCLEW